MASKGETKIRKRLNAPRTMNIKRKGDRFIVKSASGPHAIEHSVPITVVLRDMLGLASNMREVKRILVDGKVFIDGKAIKDPHHPVGFMDVFTIPSVNKFYRVAYDTKSRIKLLDIDPRNSQFKLSKIKNKTILKKGKVQLNLHDGKNILSDKECKTGDVLKLGGPSLKIVDMFPMQKGNIAYVTGGKHAGRTAIIEELVPGTAAREPLAILKDGEEEFQTRKDYVFVIGTKEPAIKL